VTLYNYHNITYINTYHYTIITGACLIIPHKKFYYIFYTKHKPKEGKHPIGVTTYAPPKPGGSFVINGNALDAWPVLGDFAYVKMLVTLILHRLNEEFLSKNKTQVGWGPIAYELKNVDYARKFFSRTGSFKAFVKAFMNVNSMSLVAYPVGLHHDHFNAGGESLENKITFVLKDCNGLMGRGGSLFNNQCVFALLDWQYEKRSARRFYVTHAEEMGLGAPLSQGAPKILQDYFTTNVNGPHYEGLYQEYMSNSQTIRRP